LPTQTEKNSLKTPDFSKKKNPLKFVVFFLSAGIIEIRVLVEKGLI
jgi:hypothetical protein